MAQEFKQQKWPAPKIAHPLWGPADFSLPRPAACTGSRSGSNTGGTGQSLEDKQVAQAADYSTVNTEQVS